MRCLWQKPNKKQHFNRKCPNPEFVNRKHGITIKVSTTLSKAEENVLAMQQAIDNKGAFEVIKENRGLKNIISQQVATPEQSHDLLTYHEVAQDVHF